MKSTEVDESLSTTSTTVLFQRKSTYFKEELPSLPMEPQLQRVVSRPTPVCSYEVILNLKMIYVRLTGKLTAFDDNLKTIQKDMKIPEVKEK